MRCSRYTYEASAALPGCMRVSTPLHPFASLESSNIQKEAFLTDQAISFFTSLRRLFSLLDFLPTIPKQGRSAGTDSTINSTLVKHHQNRINIQHASLKPLQQ